MGIIFSWGYGTEMGDLDKFQFSLLGFSYQSAQPIFVLILRHKIVDKYFDREK